MAPLSTKNKPEQLPSFTVLVVGDEGLVRALIATLLKTMGIACLEASNGTQALALFERAQPDIVVLDTQLPDMSGIEVLRHIKAARPDQWVPVIMLSSVYTNEAVARGLEAGADDYLLKPVHFPILKARIRNFINGLHSDMRLRETLEALKSYHDRAEQENEFAMHVMQRLVQVRCNDVRFQHWSKPALNFSGDVIAGTRTPDGRMHLMLADGTGHGLAAALSVMPVVEVFYGMSSKGLPLEEICHELNRKLHRLMPVGRFVCAALVAIDPAQQTLCVWNGGIPDVLCVNGERQIAYRWPSKHLPLGVVGASDFDARCETYRFSQGNLLFMCSDGLLDAQNDAEIPYGEGGVTRLLESLCRGERLTEIAAREIAPYCNKTQDDISVVAVHLDFNAP